MDSLKNIHEGNFQIEIAHLEDLDAYKDIRIESLTRNPEAFGETLQETLAKTNQEWKDGLQRKDLFLVLAKNDFTLKGAKSIAGAKETEEKSIWRILAVYTRPESRKRGLSEKVLQKVLEEIKKRGGTKATLNVTIRPEQEAARAVYQKLGFKEAGRFVEEGEEIIKMELDLTSTIK